MEDELPYSELWYGQHSLQKVGVWIPQKKHQTEVGTPNDTNIWVIYIHGGAWRDPRITNTSFAASCRCFLSSYPDLVPHLDGFASLDYRLSPHPSFPQDPDLVPADELRAARHPDHLLDVRAGLAALQHKYGFGSRYVLIGHSCGATLALQVVAGLFAPVNDDLAMPLAVIGVDGLYDFRGVVSRFGPGYDPLFRVPFGDEREWDKASPSKFENLAERGKGIEFVLAWSKDDELVDVGEIDAMERSFKQAGVLCKARRNLSGLHNEIWEKGEEVAKLMADTMTDMLGKES